MTPEHEKLLQLLASLDEYIVEQLVNMSYSMRVKHPRPRAGMHRFVFCDSPVEVALAQTLGKHGMRIRLAVPAIRTDAELAEKTRLEVYEEDGTLFCIIPLSQLTETLTVALRAELLREVGYYYRPAAASV